jgi:hypothetical protein
MRAVRSALVLGGLFNAVMGSFFFSDSLLAKFLNFARTTELTLFSRHANLAFPSDPVHLLLIHGFGAAALILGATLVYSARNPMQYVMFIFFDGIGRLMFGVLMVVYVFRYSLLATILVFALIELTFAAVYLGFVLLSVRKEPDEQPEM